MKDFKFIKNGLTESGCVDMLIYSDIGGFGLTGDQFAHELNYLVKYHDPKPKEIRVRINSAGGSVVEAFGIFSAILNANNDGEVEVNTYNDGICASSGGFILMAGANIFVKDYSRLMLHGVSFANGKKNISENEKNTLETFKDMIKSVFVSKTSVSEEVIENYLTNGLDNWITAKEGADLGFFPEANIEETGVNLEVENNALLVYNKASNIINKTNVKQSKMKSITSFLKLEDGTPENEILNKLRSQAEALTSANNKIEGLKDDLNAKDQIIDALNVKIGENEKQTATAIVENAIKDGKFNPKNDAEKTTLIETAVNDLDGFKNMVSLMTVKSQNIINHIDSGSDNDLSNLIENKTFRQLEKNDPQLLKRLKAENLSKFVELYNAQYKSSKKEEDFK